MSPGIDKAIAPVLNIFYSLAIAFVVIAIISAIVAKSVGGKTRQQRKATFSLVSAVLFLLYFLFVMPKLLGKGS